MHISEFCRLMADTDRILKSQLVGAIRDIVGDNFSSSTPVEVTFPNLGGIKMTIASWALNNGSLSAKVALEDGSTEARSREDLPAEAVLGILKACKAAKEDAAYAAFKEALMSLPVGSTEEAGEKAGGRVSAFRSGKNWEGFGDFECPLSNAKVPSDGFDEGYWVVTIGSIRTAVTYKGDAWKILPYVLSSDTGLRAING